jgi:hypothetical protein
VAATRAFKWEELQTQGRVSAGVVLPPEPGSPGHRLRVDNDQPKPTTVTVLTVDPPQIAGPRYRLRGQVRYDNVEGAGYLEMWNYFPDGDQYFSRTLAETGPMMKLHATSGWRSFELPFDATGAPPPTRLVLNVVLQGRGTVYLGPLELTEDSGVGGRDDEAVGRFAGLPGGVVAGAVLGSIGALLGVLTSLGRARRFVIGAALSLIAFGGLAFIAGILAFGSPQASSNFYLSLLLLGFLTCVVPLGLLPVIKKRYEDIELRAMRARDIG